MLMTLEVVCWEAVGIAGALRCQEDDVDLRPVDPGARLDVEAHAARHQQPHDNEVPPAPQGRHPAIVVIQASAVPRHLLTGAETAAIYGSEMPGTRRCRLPRLAIPPLAPDSTGSRGLAWTAWRHDPRG